ncbi:hypothetical protein RHCRD62_10298 [Rhodococcus sp. RD6.2]|nr:hypothetical protein RHCRD62_10298 [Rhodococcus sp. RD6.2]
MTPGSASHSLAGGVDPTQNVTVRQQTEPGGEFASLTGGSGPADATSPLRSALRVG